MSASRHSNPTYRFADAFEQNHGRELKIEGRSSMRESRPNNEPLCETSEKGEKIFTKDELVPVGLEIGRRILEIFGYQKISSIVFRLRSTSEEINAVIDGDEMPTVELLLAVHRTTGASIDWLLTGKGDRYIKDDIDHTALRPLRRRRHVSSKRVTGLKHQAR
jgi:hypothetical protein